MGNVRFYKYYFRGMDKPVIMETTDKATADNMLQHLSQKSNTQIDMSRLEDFKVETPLVGISVKKRNGGDLVWVGKEFTSDGWLSKEEFDRIENLKKQQ
jgi:hypothetical protein